MNPESSMLREPVKFPWTLVPRLPEVLVSSGSGKRPPYALQVVPSIVERTRVEREGENMLTLHLKSEEEEERWERRLEEVYEWWCIAAVVDMSFESEDEEVTCWAEYLETVDYRKNMEEML